MSVIPNYPVFGLGVVRCPIAVDRQAVVNTPKDVCKVLPVTPLVISITLAVMVAVLIASRTHFPVFRC